MSSTRLIQRFGNPSPVSTPLLIIIKVVLCAIPIAQIAIGAVHLNDCPRQHYIPIYLIVVGVFSVMLALLSCLPCAHEPEDGPPNTLARACMSWNSLVSLFLFGWFIAGNVWVYSIYKPNYNKETTALDPYCDQTVYHFAFSNVTVAWILIGIGIVGGCLSRIFSRQDQSPSDNV